jgi:tetratricopeptide (TPR) repeat protein
MTQIAVRPIAWLIFLFFFCLYLFTFSPALRYEENIDFVDSVSGNRGLPYIFTIGSGITSNQIAPRGYSLWYPLAVTARQFPFVSLLRRLGIISALFGALSIKLLFQLLLHFQHMAMPEERTRTARSLFKNLLPALVGALTLGLCRNFWRISTGIGPYTLNAFLFYSILLLMLKYRETRERKNLYGAFLVMGLVLSNFSAAALVIPVVGILFVVFDFMLVLRPTNLLGPIFVFLLGACSILILPLQSRLHPLYVHVGDFLGFADGIVDVLKTHFKILKSDFLSFESFKWGLYTVLPIGYLFWRRRESKYELRDYPPTHIKGDLYRLLKRSHAPRALLILGFMVIGLFFFLQINPDGFSSVAIKETLDFIRPESFAPSTAMTSNLMIYFPQVLGALWFGYGLGYVMIIITGRNFVRFHPKAPVALTSKRAMLCYCAFVLPLILFFVNISGFTGRGTEHIDKFCADIIGQAKGPKVLFVEEKTLITDGWPGFEKPFLVNALRYNLDQSGDDETIVVELNALNTAGYYPYYCKNILGLRQLPKFVGGTDMSGPVYEQLEEKGVEVRWLISDLRPINLEYRFVPKGFLFTAVDKKGPAPDVYSANESAWKNWQSNIRFCLEARGASLTNEILRYYSRALVNQGLYDQVTTNCQVAFELYGRALDCSRFNPAAHRNLGAVSETLGLWRFEERHRRAAGNIFSTMVDNSLFLFRGAESESRETAAGYIAAREPGWFGMGNSAGLYINRGLQFLEVLRELPQEKKYGYYREYYVRLTRVMFHQALDIEYNSLGAIQGLGRLASWKNNYREATKLFVRVLKNDPYHPSIYDDIIKVAVESGSTSKLRKFVMDGYKRNVDSWLVYRYAGDIFMERGEEEKAEAAYLKSIGLKRNAGAYAQVALLYYERGEVSKGFSVVRDALEKFPDESILYRSLSQMYLGLGQLRVAVDNMDKAFRLQSDSAIANLRMADLLWNTGQKERSVLYLKDAYNLAIKGFAIRLSTGF